MSTSRALRMLAAALAAAGLPLAVAACGDDTGGAGGGDSGSNATGAESLCGDNLFDPDLGEECDDGDLDNGDGCTTECTEARCGDGYVHEGFEDCDDGNGDDGDKCKSDCTAGVAGCGNGAVEEGEECDDGNEADDDACSRDCKAARCGDGIVQEGEACDDANASDEDACTNACQPNGDGCGNGAVDGGEECDDGNASNADDCLVTCENAYCGDGYAQAGVEACDDGNGDDSDFCRSDCTLNEAQDYGCPGVPVSVGLGGASVAFSTAGLGVEESGSCGGLDAPEIVFEVIPEESGVLLVTLSADDGSYDPVLHASEGTCGGTEIGCADISFAGGVEELQLDAVAGESLWVVADGYGTSAGAFTIDFLLLGGAPGDTCPGVPVQLDAFEQVDLSGNTSSAEDDLDGTCPGSGGPDVVYAITTNADGIVNVALQAAFDAMIYSQIDCGDTSSELDCTDSQLAEGVETHQLPAYAGETLYLVVDGYDGGEGPFSLTLSLQPD
ncbi:MAG TPA: DUF4215 domain-containing protein [Acidimicrobiales bacterium]